jgi:hypothetical protein
LNLRFGDLVSRHLANVAQTEKLEADGRKLLTNGFEPQSLELFIRDVCKWGGYAGIAGRVLRRNDAAFIGERFYAAGEVLRLRNKAFLRDALAAINGVNQLGTPSFASNHLRFLAPMDCAILDSEIKARLGYDFNGFGYEKYSDDCRIVANALMESNIRNPLDRESEAWFVADVDMALTAHYRF